MVPHVQSVVFTVNRLLFPTCLKAFGAAYPNLVKMPQKSVHTSDHTSVANVRK